MFLGSSSIGGSSIGGSSTGGSSTRGSSTEGSSTTPSSTVLSSTMVRTMRMLSCEGSARTTSHSQQSLHFKHFSQMWLLQASLVHRTQIRVDASPQMLQVNGMAPIFSFLKWLAGVWVP